MTAEEKEVLDLLEYVPVNSVTGYGIYEIIDSGDEARQQQMLKDLHQQATEANSSILEQLLGTTLINKITKLYAQANDQLPANAAS